jgi:hypothetical protein
VDIGAYDSIFLSNTLNLHSSGWTGINIDASPTRLSTFFLTRPTDINLNYAIGDENLMVTLYDLTEDSSSTINPKIVNSVQDTKPVSKRVSVPSITMKQLC